MIDRAAFLDTSIFRTLLNNNSISTLEALYNLKATLAKPKTSHIIKQNRRAKFSSN